jgi:protein ImuB
VAARLTRCGRGATCLECRLHCPPAGNVDLSVGLYRATASARHLLDLVRMRLERASLPAPVAALSVCAAETAALEYRQQELFCDGPPRERPRQLAALIDRLSSRLGRRAVLRTVLLAEAQPELAYRYEPLVEGEGSRRVRRRTSRRGGMQELTLSQGHAAPARPLRLFPRPVFLAAISVTPDGPPFHFRWRGREHRVAQSRGPERIETGWWRGRAIGRDYYRVQTAAGDCLWLFRRLRDGQWFLHGAFE